HQEQPDPQRPGRQAYLRWATSAWRRGRRGLRRRTFLRMPLRRHRLRTGSTWLLGGPSVAVGRRGSGARALSSLRRSRGALCGAAVARRLLGRTALASGFLGRAALASRLLGTASGLRGTRPAGASAVRGAARTARRHCPLPSALPPPPSSSPCSVSPWASSAA